MKRRLVHSSITVGALIAAMCFTWEANKITVTAYQVDPMVKSQRSIKLTDYRYNKPSKEVTKVEFVQQGVIEVEPAIPELVQVKTTAYCSCKKCCGHSHGITKSGKMAEEGLTVASNTYYGKMVELYDENKEYIGTYECMDTGVRGIDIYMESHQKALNFGVHQYYVRVIN